MSAAASTQDLPADCRRILIVRLSSVGDIVLACPVADLLRQRYPQARIQWLVDAGYEALLAGQPHLDGVIGYDFAGRHHGPRGIRALAAEIGPVDLMVDLQHKVRTSLLARALKPAWRRVLVKRSGVDLMRALVGRDPILRGPHQALRYLQLLADAAPPPVPRPAIAADVASVAWAADRMNQALGARPPVGLVTSARHWTKRWPSGHLRDLAVRCLEAGAGVVLLGGREDGPAVDALAADLGPGTLAHGGPGLARLAALLSLCRVVVSPDSGPAHMAAALGCSVISLFGPTSPERWAPLGERVQVLRIPLPCSPCSNHGSATCPVGTLQCMRELGPEMVFDAVRASLEVTP